MTGTVGTMTRRASIVAAALLIAGAASAQAQMVYYGSPMIAAPMAAAPMAMAPMVMVAPVYAPVVVNTAPMVLSFYQVKRGGRLDAVARKVGVPVADLIRINPTIAPNAWLSAGTLVALPIP